MPWILKFLAAPAIDLSVRRGASLKRWILTCQIAMAATLLPLAFVDWAQSYALVVGVVTFHAVFAAVQDVSIDTLAIRSVPASELGRVNGFMQTGMLGGRAAVAAGSTLLASIFGTPAAAVVALAILIVAPAIVVALAVDERKAIQKGAMVEAASRGERTPLRSLVTRATFAGLLVALTVGAGFEFFGVSAGPRLLDLGATDLVVSSFYGFFAPASLAAGALIGGVLADRIGAIRGTVAGLAAVSAVLTLIAVADPAPPVAWFSLAYVGIGLLTSSSYALLMALARGPLTATRFSLFMAMTNACEAGSGFLGGRLADDGYGSALLTMTVLAFIALAPLYWLAKHGPATARMATEPPRSAKSAESVDSTKSTDSTRSAERA